MNRSDGYRLKGCSPFYEIIPYIMDKRYDATNYIDMDIDADMIADYVAKCREKGVKMNHMSVVIAAYLRTVSQHPHLNRFVVNKRIYARNHFCVTFSILKGDPADPDETVVKVYFNMDDTIFDVHEKLTKAITSRREEDEDNSMDKLLSKVMKIPFLMPTAVAFLKWLDKHFTLPFAAIDGSPFHTSMFITNLASIRLNAVYHHIYQFGTTSVFIALGQAEKKLALKNGELIEKRVYPVKVTTDERIEDGHYFSKCFREFKKYIKHPELLEVKPEKVVKDENIKVRNPKFIVK